MPTISKLSEVSPKAQIADDVEIGPFCMVGPDVKLGAGCRLIGHVVLTGHTTIGKGNIFYPNAVVGLDPQDKKFHGETTFLVIGDGNQIREGVSVHTGTGVGGAYTRIGDRNLIMGNCHVAHDVQIGNDCIIANCVALAGHVVVGNRANVGGLTGIHHFVTLGDYCYVAGVGRIAHDVPPYVKADHQGRLRGLNTEGLLRARFEPADIEALEDACRRLFRHKTPLAQTMREFSQDGSINAHVKSLLDFLERRGKSKFGRHLEGQRKAESFLRSAKTS